jgi:hypothetical protein
METKAQLSSSTRPFADWRLYAAAAGASLAAASSADAAIIYLRYSDGGGVSW